MQKRLPVEHFHFPVEKIKSGYYSDAYFLRTEEILTATTITARYDAGVYPRKCRCMRH